jgi:hypothetical protein
MRKVGRLIGKGVGLAAESIEHHKEKKRSATPSPNRGPSSSSIDGLGHDEAFQKSQPQYGGPQDSDSEESEVEDDEEAWELDEAADPPEFEDVKGEGLPPDYKEVDDSSRPSLATAESSSSSKALKIQQKVAALATRCGTPAPRVQDEHGQLLGALPCPVVLPQRRPRTKARGFIRAYAPVLAGVGIGQDTWIDFLNQWDESSKVGYDR